MPRTRRESDSRFARYSSDRTRKTCGRCEVEKDLEEFRWKRHWRGDHRYHICRECDRASRNARRTAATERAEEVRVRAARPRQPRTPVVVPAAWQGRDPEAMTAQQYHALTDADIEAHPSPRIRTLLKQRREFARVVMGTRPSSPGLVTRGTRGTTAVMREAGAAARRAREREQVVAAAIAAAPVRVDPSEIVPRAEARTWRESERWPDGYSGTLVIDGVEVEQRVAGGTAHFQPRRDGWSPRGVAFSLPVEEIRNAGPGDAWRLIRNEVRYPSGLRGITPDGAPIYSDSDGNPVPVRTGRTLRRHDAPVTLSRMVVAPNATVQLGQLVTIATGGAVRPVVGTERAIGTVTEVTEEATGRRTCVVRMA
jgi:hypothetical protein